MKSNLLFILILYFYCITLSLFAQDAFIDEVKIMSYGLYSPNGNESIYDTNTIGSVINVHNSVNFLKITTNITATIGVRFGVEYLLSGHPDNAIIEVTTIKRYPKPGIKEPGKKNRVLMTKRKRTVRIGERYGMGYGFDDLWEIVPGEWVFELWYNGKRLFKQSFNVIKVPKGLPER